MQRFRLCALLAATLTTSVGAARVERARKRKSTGGISDETRSLWSKYVERVNYQADYVNRGLQPKCQPGLHEHQGTTYRGVVLLFHGFTACPQQFEAMIPLLTAKGYTVLAPLSPGHGYQWQDKSSGEFAHEDFIEHLPTHESEFRYFGKEMHRIVQASSGEKVVFGLSLGGGIAAYVGSLGGFDRRFLCAPMIKAAGIANLVIDLVSEVPVRNTTRRSWGEGCEKERSEGRAGICQFNALIGRAARNLGQQWSEEPATAKYTTDNLQIVFVENDQAVSSEAIVHTALTKFNMTTNSPNLCGLDAAIGHSFLSPYDNVGKNMYWLPEMQTMIIDYLADGVLLPQGGGTKSIMTRSDGKIAAQDFPRCNVRATP